MKVIVSVLAVTLILVLSDATRAAEEAFVIGPEDVLDIQVWDNKDLSQSVFVAPDGKISLPLIGQVQAAGQTVQQLQDDIARQYGKTVKVPSVAVILKKIESRPVYLTNGFVKTGSIQLTRNNVTLLDIVSISGGILPLADAEKGFIVRGNDDKISVNFERLLAGDMSQNVKLQPFDKIIIPPAQTVTVLGEVRTPGQIKYRSDLTVARAVTQAGGTTRIAAPGRIDLHRLEGDKMRVRIDLDKILESPRESPDTQLLPGDIINVPERRL